MRRLFQTNPDIQRERHRRYVKTLQTPEDRRRHREKKKAKFFAKQEQIAGRPMPSACEICGGNRVRIVFDHCHNSGKFRGWICSPCNVVLGLMNDDPNLLRKLADYLDTHAPVTPIS